MDILSDDEGTMEQFPVGMHVLAVDDNPTCLRKLEELLLRCKYHVTTTKEAKAALEMLREKSNKFDLVISDVEMPDMDGFKLLELVSLEMDLPVIMLSAHSDYEHVMRGIRHGACDYLVKPVAMKELRNIWQHVVRNNTSSYARNTVGPSCQLLPPHDTDQALKVTRKRKDTSQDNIDDGDENNDSDGQEEGGDGNESEHDDIDESCTRKKPRVVWASELHQKFVAAVTQLGPDKAVPKKILHLMNVEGLTRENVASHLQKYRLYLKKMDETHLHHRTAYGTKDHSFLHAQLDGFKDFHNLVATRQLPISALLSRQHAPIVTGLNSPTQSLINLHGLTSSSNAPLGHYQNMTNSTNISEKYHSPLLSGIQNMNSFHPTSPPLEASQFPGSKFTAYMEDYKIIGDRAICNDFLYSRPSFGSSSSTSLASASGNSLVLQAKYQRPMQRILAGNQFSLQGAPSNSDSLGVGVHGSSKFSSTNRGGDSWQESVKTPKFSLGSLPQNHSLNQDEMEGNKNFRGITGNSPVDFNSFIFSENSGGETQCQSQFSGNFVQNMNTSDQQNWEEHGRNCTQLLNSSFSHIDVLAPTNGVPMDIINAAGSKGPCGSLMSQIDVSAILNSQHADLGKPPRLEPEMKSNKCFSLEQTKSGNCFINDQHGTFDDIMNEMMKQDESMAGGFGLDSFPLP